MKMIAMTLGLLALMSCGPVASTARHAEAFGISNELVREIERRVDMPPGANVLRDYNRYYARGSDPNTIEAVFLRRTAFLDGPSDAVALVGVSNAYAVERLPIIFDGMCAVVKGEFYLREMGLVSSQSDDPMAPRREPQNVHCGGT